jgi:hypothetical protein
VAKQAVALNEDTCATACSVHRSFEPIRVTATNGPQLFSLKLGSLFAGDAHGKEALGTNTFLSLKDAGNLQLAQSARSVSVMPG